jgi:ABC-type multidrug transport system ATPase subunit
MTAAAATTAGPELLVEALGLSVGDRNGVLRVAGLDLRLAAGQAVVLEGPVDARTAVLRTLIGLVRPLAGQVRLLGADPARPRGATMLQEVGWLPRQGALLANLTLRENLHLPLEFHRGRGDAALVRSALRTFGLEEVPDLRPERVALPIRRRVALARAILLEPRLLLLDDPLHDLDDASADALGAALARWARAPGRALLVASHDRDLAAALSASRSVLPVIPS